MSVVDSRHLVSGLRVVIVDDEADFARGLVRLVSGHFPGLDVLAAQSGEEALRILSEKPAQLMITDLRMPEMTGQQLLVQALAVLPELSMVVLTAYGTIETAVEALRVGAYDFVTKPIEPDQLFRVVEKGLERSRLLNENSRLRQILAGRDAGGELVGEGSAMQQLRRSIAAVAQSEYTVLIRGESGTGKELVARMIHHLGSRAGRPFLVVNCPSIPENLLESELFGHAKGAFTGADRDHKGLFAAADKGTIHLDEIGDIAPAVQLKLLRVLQEGEVRPVGVNRSMKIDVRVVASTNQDLEAALQARTFREDLYYRLNVLSITLPPLRERREDIALLAGHFLRKACLEMGIAEKQVEPEVLAWMTGNPWPGNVRELQSFVRRLAVFATSERVDMSLVRLVLQDGGHGLSGLASAAVPSGSLGPYKSAKADVVASFTQTYVRALLAQTRGNISEAARISGISRVALQKILARTGEKAARFKDQS